MENLFNLTIGYEDYLKMRHKQDPMIRSERASVIKELVDGINRTRPLTYEKDGKIKTVGKITPRAVAIKVGHLKMADLYYLLSICKNAQDFGKCFFGSLKV